MEKDDEIYDPYEREQDRLREFFEEVSTDEEDPYADIDNEFGSDTNYEPSESSSSESDVISDSEIPVLSRNQTSILQNQNPSTSIEPANETVSAEPLLRGVSPVSSDADAEWETTTAPIRNFIFDESSNCLKINIGPDSTPIQAFECLFTSDILKYLVECSNNYGEALAKTNRPKTRNSRDATFRSITNEEMKKFLGLCLLQGQISTTNMRRYFSYTDVLYFHPIFSYIMSGRRFEQILRVMCCSSLKSKNKEKVQSLIDMLISQFQSAYGPTKELSIDESLLHFRGRLGFRVYIKNKKSRYGIKFFELTTSDGYLLNMEMYSGGAEKDIESDNTKTEALVLRLMKPYLMKGHDLYMDNYYNSYELSQKLLNFKTHTNGTLRSNRKSNPKPLVQRKLKKGEHFWVRKKETYVSKWKDKRDVLVITTRNHPRMISVKNRFGREQMKPEEVRTYNDHMAGIDRCDQMTATYSTPRKTLRWYKKVIFYLLDVTVWNSFYLYRKFCKNNSRKYRFIQFRDELIKSLFKIPRELEGKHLIRGKKNDNRRLENTSQESESLGTNSEGHWPEKNPGVPSAKSRKKSIFLKCRLCTTKSLRKETSYRCKGCVEKPPLCPDCFEEWHLVKK